MSKLLTLLLGLFCASVCFASSHPDRQMVELTQRGRVFPPLHVVGLSLSQALEEGELSDSPLTPEDVTPPVGEAPPPPEPNLYCEERLRLWLVRKSRGPESIRGSKCKQCAWGGTVGLVCSCDRISDSRYRDLGRAITLCACGTVGAVSMYRGWSRNFGEGLSEMLAADLGYLGGCIFIVRGFFSRCIARRCLYQAEPVAPVEDGDRAVEEEVASPTVIDSDD